MLDTATVTDLPAAETKALSCRVAVIWIDWYAYHLARFQGLLATPALAGRVSGIELVGGVGVHAGLKFRETRDPSLPVTTLMPGSSWKDAGQWTLARAVWAALTTLRPETVLVPGYYTLPALAAALWAKLHGATSVLMTESTAEDHSRTRWKEALKSLIIRTFFDWAIAGGEAHVRYLRMLGVSAHRIARSYDVVDNAFFARSAAALRSNSFAHPENASPYFLYVGRLAPEKNIEALLGSWISYRAAGGTWPLVLVGDGPSAPSLRHAAAASAFVSEVHFAGLKTSTELPPFYAFAGCFVLPSIREPWGLVVNEAMASGLPVLVSSRCGCAEDLVVTGRNGFTFDPAVPAQLTRLLAAVSNLDSGEREAMGKASLDIISRFSPEGFGQEVARICNARNS